MSVYVDPVQQHNGSKTFRWERSCHMYADTVEELHAMAQAIGLRRSWFQADRDAVGRPSLPHYDLVPTRRKEAIAAGAMEHTREQMHRFLHRNDVGQVGLFGG
jgi:hypothetical protein